MSNVSVFGYPEKETKHSVCPTCKTAHTSCELCGYTLHCPQCDKICKACYELKED